jgi:hypothetical protein
MAFFLIFSVAPFPAFGISAPPPAESGAVRLYSDDSDHLWNRLHEALFVRTGPDGARYGLDRTDPLLWGNSMHLLTGASHTRAVEILDRFIESHAERMIEDPLKRAFLQHDLWALFDWSTHPSLGNAYTQERMALQARLAVVIHRLAMPEEDIRRIAVQSAPSFLADPIRGDGAWIQVGLRSNEVVAPTHVREFGGRSLFQVWLSVPGGKHASVSYLDKLRAYGRSQLHDRPSSTSPQSRHPEVPQFPAGTRWALTRRMLVIDSSDRVRSTSWIESIQLREYRSVPASAHMSISEQRNAQTMYEFVAQRSEPEHLRQIKAGDRDFVQFSSTQVDPFELSSAAVAALGVDGFVVKMQADRLASCLGCHGSGSGIHSVRSYTRGLPLVHPPELIPAERDREFEKTVNWKRSQLDFGLLQNLLRERNSR